MSDNIKKTICDVLMLFIIILILFFVYIFWAEVKNYQSERETITIIIDEVSLYVVKDWWIESLQKIL